MRPPPPPFGDSPAIGFVYSVFNNYVDPLAQSKMGAKNRPRHKLNKNAVCNGTLNMTLSKTENFVDFFFHLFLKQVGYASPYHLITLEI